LFFKDEDYEVYDRAVNPKVFSSIFLVILKTDFRTDREIGCRMSIVQQSSFLVFVHFHSLEFIF